MSKVDLQTISEYKKENRKHSIYEKGTGFIISQKYFFSLDYYFQSYEKHANI